MTKGRKRKSREGEHEPGRTQPSAADGVVHKNKFIDYIRSVMMEAEEARLIGDKRSFDALKNSILQFIDACQHSKSKAKAGRSIRLPNNAEPSFAAVFPPSDMRWNKTWRKRLEQARTAQVFVDHLKKMLLEMKRRPKQDREKRKKRLSKTPSVTLGNSQHVDTEQQVQPPVTIKLDEEEEQAFPDDHGLAGFGKHTPDLAGEFISYLMRTGYDEDGEDCASYHEESGPCDGAIIDGDSELDDVEPRLQRLSPEALQQLDADLHPEIAVLDPVERDTCLRKLQRLLDGERPTSTAEYEQGLRKLKAAVYVPHEMKILRTRTWDKARNLIIAGRKVAERLAGNNPMFVAMASEWAQGLGRDIRWWERIREG